MSNWKKSGDYKSLLEIITKKNGLSAKDILDPKPISPDSLENLRGAAGYILAAIDCDTPIYIVGDYDADGITSTAILYKMITALGGRVSPIIPRRFTDGYGISANLIKDIRDSLIITVDNGISANEAILVATEQKNTVIIIDHHLPQEIIPAADIIIDPHVSPEKNDFTDYCGAGLAYKLAELMCELVNCDTYQIPMLDITVLACLGTIADVMPMISDNRHIIKKGLKILNDENAFNQLSAGIRSVMQLAGAPYTEDTIKFQIGPILNACGRLYDHGSLSVLKELLTTDERLALQYAAKMKEVNDRRKAMVSAWFEKIEPNCKEQSDQPIIILRAEEVPEGIVGILTGKIAEAYKRPAFLFTRSKDDQDVYKGSGRSFGGFDISPMVNAVLPLCVTGGGHAGAAGLSVRSDNWQTLCDTMTGFMIDHGQAVDTSLYYDMEITEEEVEQLCNEQKLFAPYGEGVEKPIFLIRNFKLIQNQYGDTVRLMGSKSEHIKLMGGSVSAVAFGMAEKYISMGQPKSLDLLFTIDENTYKGKTTPQLSVIDMRAGY